MKVRNKILARIKSAEQVLESLIPTMGGEHDPDNLNLIRDQMRLMIEELEDVRDDIKKYLKGADA